MNKIVRGNLLCQNKTDRLSKVSHGFGGLNVQIPGQIIVFFPPSALPHACLLINHTSFLLDHISFQTNFSTRSLIDLPPSKPVNYRETFIHAQIYHLINIPHSEKHFHPPRFRNRRLSKTLHSKLKPVKIIFDPRVFDSSSDTQSITPLPFCY